jgi:hypothetical protein
MTDDDDKIVFEFKRVPVQFFRYDPPKPPKNRIKAWFWHRKQEYNAAKWIGLRTIPPNWANRVIDVRRRYWYRPKYWTLHKLGRHTNYCEQVFGCHRRKRPPGTVIAMAEASA